MLNLLQLTLRPGEPRDHVVTAWLEVSWRGAVGLAMVPAKFTIWNADWGSLGGGQLAWPSVQLFSHVCVTGVTLAGGSSLARSSHMLSE